MNHEFDIVESSIQLDSNTHKIFHNLEIETVNKLITRHKSGQRDFRGIDLNGLDLSGIDLSHTDLRGANFFNCELRCANLDGADLRGANFKNANLKAATLKNCDLSEANLTDTEIGHAILNGANLSNSIWMRVSCYRTSMNEATLPDGTKWQFKTFLAGKNLSAEDLLVFCQRSHTRRKQLAQLFVILIFVLGFYVARLTLPLAFALIGW
ncbi:MAG: pentapeptide repeat-containing protein [Hydrococcus sp. RM1_1_31]|nr:pentapeptide repeat-containing protein [Hydrococcus sp. RM1_1_31]